ncbi:aminotransferase class V-fold PLP-dependent enzyme [Algivirga pacifica]|uniref:Aminotransferase class V-fold PLP-dependent enzyme n=1 Tax=Algivirga pacifica TaxID=1162670 RepID=A0ABP9D428_9BACT
MEQYFSFFKQHIIGEYQTIDTPYHKDLRIVYADWTASGRMYAPIEQRLQEQIFPLVANTHTDTNDTGSAMTYAYHKAQQIIKKHVGAGKEDVLISSNAGMTGVVNKFQRILGLKVHEQFKGKVQIAEEDRPVVFISHMEHHSNQTTWLETIAEVVIIPPDEEGLVSVENLEKLLQKYADRKMKIVSVTSCSNVTGIMTPYMDIAELTHKNGGVCFVDFACSAPYVQINMHEDDEQGRYLDAIYFSPHKFLGGPGTTGILLFNQKLYGNSVPDNPGGGTVDWTNPWGQHKYVDDIEAREDGGTPAFLQTMKAAMCMQLKEDMGVENILAREEELLQIVWERFEEIPNVHVLAPQHKHRLGVISFYIEDLHYNLGVKILNDRFGIQVRGGCSCAGTYGHYLLNVSPDISENITCMINEGDNSLKPGWIRMSIHPTMTDEELIYIMNSIQQLSKHHQEWVKEYDMDLVKGHIRHQNADANQPIKEKMDKALMESFGHSVVTS